MAAGTTITFEILDFCYTLAGQGQLLQVQVPDQVQAHHKIVKKEDMLAPLFLSATIWEEASLKNTIVLQVSVVQKSQ